LELPFTEKYYYSNWSYLLLKNITTLIGATFYWKIFLLKNITAENYYYSNYKKYTFSIISLFLSLKNFIFYIKEWIYIKTEKAKNSSIFPAYIPKTLQKNNINAGKNSREKIDILFIKTSNTETS
jgi:hypothetical protein